jgi:endogenous inhibitor of DNA gyrase (YacG/DUF329 family)
MKVKCPKCGKEYEFDREKNKKMPSFFPFCSQRCKLIDLGAWLDGDYKIESPLKPENTEDSSQ